MSTADRLAEAQRLASWVEQAGGSCKAASVVETPDRGLGLVAASALKRGDVVASVPLSLGISAETALRSSLGPYLTEFEPALADYAFIAVSLLHERRLGDQSELSAWLSSASLLPEDGFADLPLLWDRDGVGISELDGATTAGATKRRNALLEDYWWLKENVFDPEPVFFPEVVFSYDAYAAALAIAISRSVTISVGADAEPAPVLMPMLDLVNHRGAAPN